MLSLKIRNIALFLFVEIILFETSFSHKGHEAPSKLIVISFDGFRWDYLDLVKKNNRSTPNFDTLLLSGSSILNDGVKNAFITKTFPNHYSLATGFYEENHGVVANQFYDPEYKEVFDISSQSAKNQKWWDGRSGMLVDPIWIAYERHQPGKSGVIFWPGSDVEDQRPSHLLEYNTSISLDFRRKTLINWFLDENPINFGMLYYEEPDRTGHKYGPESKELISKVIELDGFLGSLMEQLKTNNLYDKVNIIITSDHGMVEQTGIIYLSDHLETDTYQLFGSSPVFNLLPNQGLEDVIYNKLKDVPHLHVYKKNNIPDDFHYRNNRRIMPLVISAAENYMICLNKNITSCLDMKGNHGYNNSLKSMHPIFIAAGPAFKKNYLAQPFEIVDIYSLICVVLGLNPIENNGKFSRVSDLLYYKRLTVGEDIVFISVILLVLCTALIFSLCACYNHAEYFAVKSVNFSTDSFKEGQKRLLAAEEDDELV